MQMFDSEVRQISKSLSLPYPERADFEVELRLDMTRFYRDLIESGVDPDFASQTTIKKFSLEPEILRDMRVVHMSSFDKLLESFPETVRSALADFTGLSVLAIFTYFLFKEAPMISFLTEGGIAVYLIIVTAAVGLVTQLYRSFVFFVKRDHSEDSLRANDSLPLYAAAITFLVGILGTAIGYYVVVGKWASNVLSDEQLRIGLYEPLPCLIVSTALAATIVAAHFLIQHRLKAGGVPHQSLSNA